MNEVITITQFGAEPDIETPQTAAIQAAIDTVAEAGGGRVEIPNGTWTIGTIWLRNNIELHLSPGAILQGSLKGEDFPCRQATEEGIIISRRAGHRRLVGAWQCKNVSVTGSGCIDGRHGCSGQFKGDPMGNEGHPQNLQFIDCDGVTVRDVRLRNSGSWMQVYNSCRDVLIDGIRVWNHGNTTNDGLDIDGCEDVRVNNCHIDSHDDALVFKSTGPRPCRHIQVTNCQLRSNCHGIKFGTESVGGFEFISIQNCSVKTSAHSNRRPPITGVALECTDGGSMHHIRIDGIMVEDVFAPFFIKLGNRLDRRLDEEVKPEGIIEDIHIANIHGTSVAQMAPNITGYEGRPVRRVVVRDCNLSFEGGIEAEGILHDLPANSDHYPEIHMLTRKDPQGRSLPAWACYIRDAKDIRFINCNFRLLNDDARQPVVVERSENVDTTGVIT